MANRLSKVVGSIIGENQQAFVYGETNNRCNSYGNEVVDDVIRNKRNSVLCKLDMEKAFDHVSTTCW